MKARSPSFFTQGNFANNASKAKRKEANGRLERCGPRWGKAQKGRRSGFPARYLLRSVSSTSCTLSRPSSCYRALDVVSFAALSFSCLVAAEKKSKRDKSAKKLQRPNGVHFSLFVTPDTPSSLSSPLSLFLCRHFLYRSRSRFFYHMASVDAFFVHLV